MRTSRLVRTLAVAGVVVALAAGGIAAFAATRDSGTGTQPAVAQDQQQGKAWLGVSVEPSDNPAGLAARRIVDKSPAADAGVQQGDVITAIDGASVKTVDDLTGAIGKKSPGDKVTLALVKNGAHDPNGSTASVDVTLGERPQKRDLGSLGDKFSQYFDRFLGGQFRYLDDNGNTVTIEAFAGTVKSKTDSELTLTLNGNQGDKTFSIPSGVTVPDSLGQGDRAVVVTQNNQVKYVFGGDSPFLPGFGHGGFKLPFGDGSDFPFPPHLKPTQKANATPEA